MDRSRPGLNPTHRAVALLLAGAALLALATLLPVNVGALPRTLLAAAGAGTPSLTERAEDLLEREKLGPAALLLSTAQALAVSRAGELAEAVAATAARTPAHVPWGGWDPMLEPLLPVVALSDPARSAPVFTVMLPERARRAVRTYLANSRSAGVQSLLRTADVTLTASFTPARDAGGQPLDAIILMTALLYQGEHLSPALQRQLRGLAERAVARNDLGELEAAYLDLVSLGSRLDWISLTELLRRTSGLGTLREYAHLARVAPEEFGLIYSAALLSGSADYVAAYLLTFGRSGLDDVGLALRLGQGALDVLVQRQVPVNRSRDSGFGWGAEFALLHPESAVAVRWLGFFLAAFLLLRGSAGLVFRSGTLASGHGLTTAVLALLSGGVLVLATEPFLLAAVPPSEFALRVMMPVLGSISDPASLTPTPPTFAMDTSTLLSIGLFALLQVGWFFLCLRKIAEISRSGLAPLVQLRLMENEENLFDGGLYLGIAGTAAALVLQVLGVIQPNLLAAYSSNLFGIVCVALIKIRHVRPFKRQLILAGQEGERAPAS
jgi:hypothetical protein